MPAPRKPKKVFVQFAVAAVIAVVLGIGAVVAGISIITSVTGAAQKQQEELAAKQQELEEKEKALLAAQQQPRVITYKRVKTVVDLEPGQPINPEMLVLEETSDRPSPGDVTMMKQAVNKMVKALIPAGSVLNSADLLDNTGFLNVPSGMRAITIDVDDVGRLNGALATGVRVDVLTTVTGGEKQEAMTRTLLQDVEILSAGSESVPNLAAGPSLPKPGGGGSAVTLAVTPKQAELLTLANQMGRFHLTLRSFKDNKKNSLAGSDLTELLTGVRNESTKKNLPAAPQPAQSGWVNVNWNPNDPGMPMPGDVMGTGGGQKFEMEIYRGKAVDTKEFVR